MDFCLCSLLTRKIGFLDDPIGFSCIESSVVTNGASKVADRRFWLNFITELHYAFIRENTGSATLEAPFVKLRSFFFDRTKVLEGSRCLFNTRLTDYWTGKLYGKKKPTPPPRNRRKLGHVKIFLGVGKQKWNWKIGSTTASSFPKISTILADQHDSCRSQWTCLNRYTHPKSTF